MASTTTKTRKTAPKRSSARTTKATKSRSRKPAAKKVDRVAELQRPLWMAVGAVALAGEAVQDFLSEALKRGEKIEARARKELKKRTNGKPVAKVKEAPENIRERLEKLDVSESVLHALDLPTHDDLERLEKKVNRLARKVA